MPLEMSMRILLIRPKMNKRPMDTDLKIRMSPSLALLTLMGLTPRGFTRPRSEKNLCFFAPIKLYCRYLRHRDNNPGASPP
jgi:hypothetical protein